MKSPLDIATSLGSKDMTTVQQTVQFTYSYVNGGAMNVMDDAR